MKYFDDKLNGDILCTGNCPIRTVEGIILELTVDDKLLNKHLVNGFIRTVEGILLEQFVDDALLNKHSVKKEGISTYEDFMKASHKGGKSFDKKYKAWLEKLFLDKAGNLEFWVGKSADGQICVVERRGEEKVPMLMLLKDSTKIEERSNSMMTGPHQPDLTTEIKNVQGKFEPTTFLASLAMQSAFSKE